MIYIKAFLFAGFICALAELLLSTTKLKPGHITSLFVVIGAFLELFNIYDILVKKFGAGPMVLITSFGHLLAHGAFLKTKTDGLLGLLTGSFTFTTAGITSTIIFSFIFAILFKAKD